MCREWLFRTRSACIPEVSVITNIMDPTAKRLALDNDGLPTPRSITSGKRLQVTQTHTAGIRYVYTSIPCIASEGRVATHLHVHRR